MSSLLAVSNSGLNVQVFRDSYTTTRIGPSFSVPEPMALNTRTLNSDSEFGKYTGIYTIYNQLVRNYVIARPLSMATYWSRDGYVAVSSQFENVVGFGPSSQAALKDALLHLVCLRDDYGRLKDEEGTQEALSLRDSLKHYFVAVGS